MADPLQNKDFPELGSRTAAPVDLDENRSDNLAYQAPLEDPILKGEMNPDRQLPEGGNQRLNRTAEQIGSALGKAVNQARRAPETARRGLHIVRDRAQDASGTAADQLSASASSLAETAQQRARDFAGTAQQRAKEFVDVAEERGRVLLDRAEDLGQRVSQKGTELKQQLDEKAREVRAEARLRAQEARLRSQRLIDEKPLHVLGGIAAAAFVLGVSLRIVRSRNASRH